MTAPVAPVASSAYEVTLPDPRRAQIFDFAKAQCRHFGVELARFKMAPEGLSDGGDAAGKLLSYVPL